MSSRPSPLVSGAVFVVSVVFMAWLHLVVYPNQVVVLTYGLPLLVCFVVRDRRLLWGMAVAFLVMTAWKSFAMLPAEDGGWMHLAMQAGNIAIVGAAVHRVLDLADRVEQERALLVSVNHDLRAREEENGRQNEELQQQTEELRQQAEELQQQAEELRTQGEELRVRAEETETLNAELVAREGLLKSLLDSLPARVDERELLQRICTTLLAMTGGTEGVSAAVMEQEGDDLVVRASVDGGPRAARLPFASSFAALVMREQRTAAIHDLAERLDLGVPEVNGTRVRAILAAPLRWGDLARGAVELYSVTPRRWTAEDFRIIQWVATKCSLVLELRRLHEQLAEANADLERLVAARTAELRATIEDLEHFSYTITHDMRAPLRAMHGFARMLIDDDGGLSDDQRADFLQRIATAAARMDRLILDALDYSRAVRTELPLERVDTRKLLDGMMASYPELESSRDRIHVAPDLPCVLANEAGLTQCFSNLLSNAIKFVDPVRPLSVVIRAERRGAVARIWFEDEGIGIPPEMTARVFGLFQRASRSYDGTGIGLALVKKVAECMGGRVGFESEPGVGSRFWLEFPLAERGA
jgi:signal transduction histidine kinase